MAARAPRRSPVASTPPPAPRRRGTLVFLGLLALLGFAAATLPASLAARFLQGQAVSVTSWSGTIWSGLAQGVAASGVPIGDLRWRLHPAALLRLRVAADLELTRPDGRATARVSAGGRESVELTNVDLELPLSAFARSPSFGWAGRVQGHLDAVTIANGWLTAVRGQLKLGGVTSPAPLSAPLGDFDLAFPDPRTAPTDASTVTARVTGGTPLSVDASLSVGAGRSFEIQGTVAGDGEVPPSLQRVLGALGPPDAAGRRPFGASGTF
ncbi:MAG: type II secretion system protein N [Candidatus Binatia bacterium]